MLEDACGAANGRSGADSGADTRQLWATSWRGGSVGASEWPMRSPRDSVNGAEPHAAERISSCELKREGVEGARCSVFGGHCLSTTQRQPQPLRTQRPRFLFSPHSSVRIFFLVPVRKQLVYPVHNSQEPQEPGPPKPLLWQDGVAFSFFRDHERHRITSLPALHLIKRP